MRMRSGKTYKPNGAREIARTLRQIAAGSLKPENGLRLASVIVVVPEPAPVSKPKRAARKKAVVVDSGSTVSV